MFVARMGVIWNWRKSVTSRDTMSSGNSSSFSMPQNQEKKQLPRYEVRFTNKNHPFMWLVCETRAIFLLSDPETSLTTPRLLPLRRSRRSHGNYQSSHSSSGSSRNILKRLGRSGQSGRSYGNQALLNIMIRGRPFNSWGGGGWFLVIKNFFS